MIVKINNSSLHNKTLTILIVIIAINNLFMNFFLSRITTIMMMGYKDKISVNNNLITHQKSVVLLISLERIIKNRTSFMKLIQNFSVKDKRILSKTQVNHGV